MKNINFNFVRILLIINFLLIFFQYNKEYTVRKQLFLYYLLPTIFRKKLNNNRYILRLCLRWVNSRRISGIGWIWQRAFPVTTKTWSSARWCKVNRRKVTPVVRRVWGPSTGCSITTSELLASLTVTRPSPTPLTDNSPSSITWSLCWRDGRDQYQWLSMLRALISRLPFSPFSTTGLSESTICYEAKHCSLHFRDCSPSNLVRDFATFHIIMDLDHIPETVPKQDSLLNKVLVSMIWLKGHTQSLREPTVSFPRVFSVKSQHTRRSLTWTILSTLPGTLPGLWLEHTSSFPPISSSIQVQISS